MTGSPFCGFKERFDWFANFSSMNRLDRVSPMVRIAIVAIVALLAIYLIVKTNQPPGQPAPHALDQ